MKLDRWMWSRDCSMWIGYDGRRGFKAQARYYSKHITSVDGPRGGKWIKSEAIKTEHYTDLNFVAHELLRWIEKEWLKSEKPQ